MKQLLKHPPGPRHGWPCSLAAATAAALALTALASTPAQARVTRIVIDSTTTVTGQSLAYQT